MEKQSPSQSSMLCAHKPCYNSTHWRNGHIVLFSSLLALQVLCHQNIFSNTVLCKASIKMSLWHGSSLPSMQFLDYTSLLITFFKKRKKIAAGCGHLDVLRSLLLTCTHSLRDSTFFMKLFSKIFLGLWDHFIGYIMSQVITTYTNKIHSPTSKFC